jgi:hypothetical protein
MRRHHARQQTAKEIKNHCISPPPLAGPAAFSLSELPSQNHSGLQVQASTTSACGLSGDQTSQVAVVRKQTLV